MSGLDELRRAAETLRERAGKALPGPWGDPAKVHYGDFGWYVSGSPAGETADDETGVADAAYIATMHPGVGLALADWLESQWSDASEVMHHAYDIARLINGEGADK